MDQIGFRLVILDTEQKKVLHNISVGRYPFGVCLSPDESRAYVANVGMFEYSKIRDAADTSQFRSVDFPTSAYGTEAMVKGFVNDSVYVKGLGDPNSAEVLFYIRHRSFQS